VTIDSVGGADRRWVRRSVVSVLEFGQVPMLARPVASLPAEDDLVGGCVYEPKFDGYRAMLYMTGGRCRIQSRHGHDITSAFPDIVVDGELVVWGEDAYEFIQVQRRIAGPARVIGLSPASFIAFDLLMWDDADLRGQPLSDRRSMLEVVFVDHQMPFQVVPQTTDRAEAADWMREYSRHEIGIEGLVVKGQGSTYDPGSRGWLKLRFQDTTESVVCAVIGTVERPERLVLGIPSSTGYDVVGWTHPISAKQRRDVAELITSRNGPPDASLVAAAGEAGDRLRAVRPTLVVETSQQPEREAQHWPVFELVRVRPDLGVDEVGPSTS
jgi:ATP-dependent DNA ligase